ncbi:MAG: lipopolysaccharide/colanic/teichoic acid biosynthesis glycosyltransferase [Psychromonas sp.]|jgi:lipopolysaccharide/colanic/teichoic acid biosynthesis glycosyltransferase|uniref:sugar transferase n=1 Tax=Psychromonas sp. TaxID=1884585 RepID=UPI0039E43D13
MNTQIRATTNLQQTRATVTSYIHPAVIYGKRFFDIVFSCSALFLLSPLLPLLAMAIKLDSKGPIFYQQIRLGKSKQGAGNTFTIFKFRTMRNDAEAAGVALLATKSDPRITRIGRFLRKTRFDETPQLINILKGEMSLIGPRPERPELSSEIEKNRPFFSERTYQVLPGLTGLAQINQSYQGSVHNIDEKLGYDHAYSLAISQPLSWIKTDIRIFFQTILTVIKCNG